jgi:hypothetical protein
MMQRPQIRKTFISTHSFDDAATNAKLHGYIPKGMVRGQNGEYIVFSEKFII